MLINLVNSGTFYRSRNRLLRLVLGLPVPVLAGGAAVEEDETARERPVVETGGRDVVESPKVAIAESGNRKI